MQSEIEQKLRDQIQVTAFDHADALARYHILISDDVLPLLNDALDAIDVDCKRVAIHRLQRAIKLLRKKIAD